MAEIDNKREALITAINRVGVVGSVRAGMLDGLFSQVTANQDKFGLFYYDNGIQSQVIPGGAWTTMINNAAGPQTTTEFGPDGITSVLDPITGRLNLEQLDPGDEVYARYTVNVVPSFSGTSYEFRHYFGSPEFGSSLPALPSAVLSQGGGAGTGFFIFDTHFYIDAQDTIANGCFPQIYASNSVTLNLKTTYVSLTKRIKA